ncbi:MAG: beta-1,6-N-acetylglucosaminyltransferase [Muribaculaceae bacterium]|nr:beta-1,6-N-acetylglucosaminyltransferase [Muribaculaceae bacterium]
MHKHAYLILAHKNFGQLKKLVELLDHPRNDIFIHVDAKAADFDPEILKEACKSSGLFILPDRLNVNWGGVSIMRAEIALLKAAASRDTYDYYHLLSGMDLPIKSHDEIHRFFDVHKGMEFINLWEFKKSNLSRFRYYTIFPEGESKFNTRIINHIFKGLQMAVGYRINKDVDFRMGSQWFSITDDLARYVLSKEEWLERVFRHTSTCDEIFLPTLVFNSPFKDKLFYPHTVKSQKEVNLSNMRFIDWSRGESIRHPWTFRASDLELLENIDHFWARKFDETVDAEIIDILYRKLKEVKSDENKDCR